jgi:hypothetical protein
MKYRHTELLSAESITTAGTKTLDIKSTDVISRIQAIVRLTNNSWTPTGHPAITVTTIQLVDGSEVLFSMSGAYAQAVAFYGSRRQPFNYINYTDNGLAIAEIPIYFGRRLWDRMFALDPKQFKNLQLKITHNYALGGAAPNAATLEVWVDYFDEDQPSPIGFMRSESLWSKTLVASTKDEIQLPTDHDIRLLLPAAFSNSEEPDINIDAVRVTENADKNVLLDMGTLELLQIHETDYPWWIEFMEGRGLAATNVTLYVTPCKDIILQAQPSQDLDSYINFTWSGGNARILMDSATSTFVGSVIGRCPHGVFPIPFGELDLPDTWWHVDPAGSRKCRLTTGPGDTSALYELLMQQMKPY